MAKACLIGRVGADPQAREVGIITGAQTETDVSLRRPKMENRTTRTSPFHASRALQLIWDSYPLGVAVGPVRQTDDGSKAVFNVIEKGMLRLSDLEPVFPETFWHTIFAFNPNSHENIKRIGKGYAVAVSSPSLSYDHPS